MNVCGDFIELVRFVLEFLIFNEDLNMFFNNERKSNILLIN